MKTLFFIVLIAGLIAVLAVGFLPAYAVGHGHGGFHGHGGHGHGHFFFSGNVFIGPGWGWGGWGPWWWSAPGYPYYPYGPYYSYYSAPVVGQQQPQEYMQQAPQQEHQSYWYFCPNPLGYYPYVKKCPKGWMKVVPAPAPEGEEE